MAFGFNPWLGSDCLIINLWLHDLHMLSQGDAFFFKVTTDEAF